MRASHRTDSVRHGLQAVGAGLWLAIVSASGVAGAAEPKAKPVANAQIPNTEIQARYEQDRAKCLSGGSQQDQPTCLREAGAARDAALRDKLDKLDKDGTAYDANARQRCALLTGDDARDCLARARGEGKKSGSVESGGVLKETVTRVVKPAEPAASAP